MASASLVPPNGPGSAWSGGPGPVGRRGLRPPGVAAAGPGGACRSWSFALATGARVVLSGGWSAGRRRSHLPVAAPGGRAHACRSPRRPHGGRWREPGKPGLAEGRASARGPSGRCTPGRPQSPPGPHWRPSGPSDPGTFRWGCPRPAAGSPGRPAARRPSACRSRPCSRASAKSRSSITIAPQPPCQASRIKGADGGAEPPVTLRGGQPGQADRDGHGRPGRVPVRGDGLRGEVAVVQVDRQHRVPPQPSRAGRVRARPSTTRRYTSDPVPGRG